MKKIINLLFSGIALLLIGYYFGSYQAKSELKKEDEKPIIITQSKEKDSVQEIVSYEGTEELVSFKVHIIAASMGKENIDPNLIEIKKMFDSVTKFNEFRLVKTETITAKVGEKEKIILPDNQFLYFIPKVIKDNHLALNLRIPWVLNINLNVKNGEGFFQGGLKLDNEFMILYIEPIF